VTTTETKEKVVQVKIAPPNLLAIRFKLVGTTPLVQRPMILKHRPELDYYRAREGWAGLPTMAIASSIQGAMKLDKFKTASKRLLFQPKIGADGVDMEGNTIVRLEGELLDANELIAPEDRPGKNMDLDNGRFWSAGWSAEATVEFDADGFKPRDVVRLVQLAGAEIGVGRIRPNADRFTRRKADPDYSYGTYSVTVCE
jgi:hypothetical protein